MEKRFAEMTIEEFAAALGSADPIPGGGAAASLSAAMGAALLMMVANHTIGKKRYAEYEALNIEVLGKAESLLSSFTEGIDRDAEAFLKVSAAYKLPSVSHANSHADSHADPHADPTEELSSLRTDAISAASAGAAAVPLSLMEGCVRALELAEALLDHSNPNLRSDIIVAAKCLECGLESAACNVQANLPAIERAAPQLADNYRTQSSEYLKAASAVTSRIHSL